ncbi:MAG TPA: hypothetical protein VIY73_21395, partial [Polyangiaceae bacterium]
MRVQVDEFMHPGERPQYFSQGASGVDVQIIFDEFALRLVDVIRRAHYVVGCVAWLTNPLILAALAKTRGASIIVQKEDFLRRDTRRAAPFPKRKSNLRALYDAVPPLYRTQFPGLSGLSCCSEPTIGIRCAGFANDKSRTVPRCHHKFAIFCRENDSRQDGESMIPYAVWTGSYNWTLNGEESWENAVLLTSDKVGQAYLRQWE